MAWNQMRNTPPPRKPAGSGKSLIRGFFAALIVIVGAVIVMSIIRDQSPSDDEDAPKTAPKKIATHPSSTNSVATKPATPKKLTREEELFAKTNGYVKAAGKMLTEDGRVLTFPAPKDGEYRIVHSHGKMYRCDSKGNFVDITPKPIFDNAFEENLIGMATDGGAFLPGLFMGLDQNEVMAMLKKEVVVNKDDPEDVAQKKQAVAALKADMVAYIDEGGTFEDYVMGMRKQTVHERGLKGQAMKEIVNYLKDGNVQDAVLFCDKFNEMVGKQGMSPLKLPAHINKMLDDAREPILTEEN